MADFLIAVDMEGVHGVVGEPNKGLMVDLVDYKKAVVAATGEVNAVAKGLFEAGAGKVYLWDNHGGLDNLFMELIDSRVKKVDPPKEMKSRLGFLKDINVSGIVYIGYHSREGSLNGILAHTYNSSAIQYVKVDGKPVGELEFDSMIASFYGVPAIFAASDDVCIGQVKEYDQRITTVITKIGKGRNAAEFRPAEVVLSEIYEGVKKAAKNLYAPITEKYPKKIEIRYTRTERAAYAISEKKDIFGNRMRYGEDAHIVETEVHSVDELRLVY